MAHSAFSALVSVSGTASELTATGGLYPVLAIANNPVLPSNGSVTVPAGTTAQRVLGLGALRLNTTSGFFEVSTDNATWVNLAVGGGGIASVSGTALQIDVTAGVNPVVSIDTGYLGQTSITTLGTIATGHWQGSVIGGTYGGTGVNNGASTITVGGNTAFSGPFTFAGTITANTTVTFPTTGTLATTSATVASITGTANEIAASAATGAVTLSIPNNPILPGTGGVQIPSGTTAQRAGNAGTIRFNSQAGVFESTADGATWATLETSATGVISVSGTAGQIAVTPTTGLCVVSIDPTYVGQTSITTLGTIGTGTWAGTTIALNHGGTNAALTASNGGIVWSNATQMQILAGTATANQMLQSGSTATPSWSTATWPATTTINQLLYSSADNTVAGLATGNNGVLITSGAGAPSISSTLPAAVQGNITATGALASGSLAAGFTPVTVPLGGTGNTTFTAYSVLCAGTTATGVFQNVSGVGSGGQVLTSNGAAALPTWQAAGGGTGSTVLLATGTAANSTSIDFATFFSASYDQYLITFTNVIPATNAVIFQCLLGTGAGPSYITANYQWTNFVAVGAGSYQAFSNTSDSAVDLTPSSTYMLSSTAGNGGVSGTMWLSGTNASSKVAIGNADFSFVASNADFVRNMSGFMQPAATFTAIRFIMSSGNITSGVFRLYGLKNT